MTRVVSRWNRWKASQKWRDYCAVDGEKPAVDSRDDGKYTGRYGSLYVD